MKNYLDGGEAVVQAFRNLEVDYVMASPGSEWGAVWEALARQKVSNAPGPIYLSCAHEMLAVGLAIGYTAYTGRMQVVMLHTGVGLMQGSMGINVAQKQGIPMVVVSGESLTYGEREGFDPGGQWIAGLNVVGGTQRVVEPLVKWASQVSSPETLYEQLVRAGEIAQRTPAGPTYMAVPIETMLHEWSPPAKMRDIPPPPKPRAADEDIDRVAQLLRGAKFPVIVTEASGRETEGYDALLRLAELLAIPVVDANWAEYANFPREHDLYQGVGRPDFLDEADIVLTIRSRVPWYPASRFPARAKVVAIDEAPHRPHLVYQNMGVDIYLEGDAVASMNLLADRVRALGFDQAAVAERRSRWAAAHANMEDAKRADVQAARTKTAIDPIALFAAIGDVLPEDAIYVDETITHRTAMLKYLPNRGAQSYFRAQGGGLGQGLGIALGIKLAAKDRPVVPIIGDGAFMYNPIVQSFALAKHENLPLLVIVANNHGYEAMKKEHAAFYPDGTAAANDIFLGRPITEIDYAELAAPFGAFGRRVDTLAELPAALEEGYAAVTGGRSAILNVQVDR